MNYFYPADILLPNKKTDLTRFSCVACDQYTSEPDYWKEVAKLVGDAPSTLNITFPEIFLGKDDDARIKKINKTMDEYLKEKVFTEYKNSFIFTRRTFPSGKVLDGLVGCIDLEDYSFHVGTGSPIRATEGTIIERIPPRVKIREHAALELPHILLLVDDAEETVIEPIADMKLQKVYDFDLMQGGGHLEGYLLPGDYAPTLNKALESLSDICAFKTRYSTDSDAPLTFAVGDGNHSLATAKTCWEQKKATLPEKEWATDPARFALVELVNIHSPALVFEPIHRVLFGVNPEEFVNEFMRETPFTHFSDPSGEPVTFLSRNYCHTLFLPGDRLAVSRVQRFIDRYLQTHQTEIDYIHGADVVGNLSQEDGNLGILLPAMPKSHLFRGIASDGVLPRKTFSMGEAHEKRFYLEARKIK